MCWLGYWVGMLVTCYTLILFLVLDPLPGALTFKYWRIGWIRIDNFPTRPDIPCHHDTWHHDSLVTNYYWKLRSDPRVLVLGTWSCRVSDICTEMSFSFIWNIQNLHIWSKKFRDYREFWDAGRVLVTVCRDLPMNVCTEMRDVKTNWKLREPFAGGCFQTANF